MDKRKEANLLVKQKITSSLFSLMHRKSLSDIHITEIIRDAGVARASFYRNYSSREDVLVTLIQDVLEDFRAHISWGQDSFYVYENVLLSFRYFEQYRSYILDLYHSGFSAVLLEELNHFHESIEGNMPASSIRKYELYLYIGALYNTALIWLLEESAISAEEISAYFFDSISRVLSKNGSTSPAELSPVQ